ncbi:MAG TPA: hypothetical protein P5136_02290 [Methanofastidiosum sp.]|nr:hypothetical protein [Methanofastidiosum sp.]
MADWTCPGCPTACKLKIPIQLPDISIPMPPFPKFPPDIVIPDLPQIPQIPIPPFNLAKLCPSANRKD